MCEYAHVKFCCQFQGLYAFATGSLDRAIAQFQTAMQVLPSPPLPLPSLPPLSPQHTNCKELRVLVSLNLAISYMKVGVNKEVELASLMTSLNSEGSSIK